MEVQRPLVSPAVGGHHEQAVRDAVAHDDLLPERLGVEVRVVRFGTDGGGIDQDFRPAQGVQPGELREPLVPAGGHAQPGAAQFGGGVDLVGVLRGRAPAEEFVFVVPGGHRDVELVRAGQQLTLGGHQDRRVQSQAVVRTVRVLRPLVQGGVDGDTVPAGCPGGEPERGAGQQVLGEVRRARTGGPRTGCVVVGERIRRVAGQSEFRQEDDSGSQPGGAFNALIKFGAESRGVGVPAVLDYRDPQGGAGRGPRPCQGSGRFKANDFNHGEYSSETVVTK
ncbi:hypothetical protein D9M72_410620 [compost metagenome]